MRSSTPETIDGRASEISWRGPLLDSRAQPRGPFPDTAATTAGETLLGSSPQLRCLREQIEMVAPTDATVLVHGETGVGKELVARSIHQRSPRHDHPMITVNCSAIPRELFESEFFGHARGAFSGALHERAGRFMLADGGTLFLDEVESLALELQPKLLRALQEGEFEPVGDDRTRRSDVRIVAASNRDLTSAIRAGQFREDLYYRLNVFPVEVPPLRERKGDIAILAIAFLEMACERFQRPCLTLTEAQLEQLRDYPWPGNVRELRNVMDRAVIASRLEAPQFDIPCHPDRRGDEVTPFDAASDDRLQVVPAEEMKRRERDNLVAALRLSKGKIYGAGGAAALLGIRPTTLSARVRKLGLRNLE